MSAAPRVAVLVAGLIFSNSAQAEKKRPSSTEEIVIQGPRRSPDKNLVGWREYRSQHFLVDSDLSTFVVEGLIGKLENIRAVELASLVAEPVVIPGRVRVIASRLSLVRDELAREQYLTGSGPGCGLLNISCTQLAQVESSVEFDPFTGFGPFTLGKCGKNLLFAANYFVSRLGEPTIVLPVLGLDANSEVVAHEIAHHLAAVLFLHLPPWFREGFATFVQTVGSEILENSPLTGSHIVRGERFVSGAIGLAAPGFVAALCRDSVSAKELLAWQGDETRARPGRYHVQGWLLYHWLWNERSKQLADFQSRLSSGEDSAAAWREVFPEFNPDEPGALRSLDDALEWHRRSPRGRYYRAKKKPEVDVSYTQTPLLPTDVHMLLVDARYSTHPSSEKYPAWLRSELHNLLQEEPLQPVALTWRAELEQTSPLALLRRAATKWPEDWRAWLLLGQVVDIAAEKEAAYRMAVKLNPESAVAQTNLTLFLAGQGHPLEALAFAKTAVELAPWDAHATATLSVVDAALGQCPEALEVDERALRLSSKAPAPVQLVQVDARCRAVPAR